MKNLKLATIALFTLAIVGSANAQDANNPWVVGFGINSVDYQGPDFGNEDFFKDAFGTSDLNILPSISRLSAEKYLEKGFTLQLAGTLNKITHLSMEDDSDYIYFSVGALVKYDLNHLFGETGWFDPYVGIGGDFVDANDKSELMLNGAAGFNVWFNENLGLNFQHGWKKGYNDNVANHFQTTAGLVIKFGGKDTDGDGIYDQYDDCPDQPGLPAFNGCPDNDGDGIVNSKDSCPDVAGLVEFDGCPDTDGDGIPDTEDRCVNEPGSIEMGGCPDTDGDGVADVDDGCIEVAGPIENSGCPWPDTDGDGVLDKDDKCPNVVGLVNNAGCPNPSEEIMEKLNAVGAQVPFDLNKALLGEKVKGLLDFVADIMKEYSESKFIIEGHTDSSGPNAFNQKLSENRANSVKDYLINSGISADRMSAVGFGEGQPTVSNDTRKGRMTNRRVEFKVED